MYLLTITLLKLYVSIEDLPRASQQFPTRVNSIYPEVCIGQDTRLLWPSPCEFLCTISICSPESELYFFFRIFRCKTGIASGKRRYKPGHTFCFVQYVQSLRWCATNLSKPTWKAIRLLGNVELFLCTICATYYIVLGSKMSFYRSFIKIYLEKLYWYAIRIYQMSLTSSYVQNASVVTICYVSSNHPRFNIRRGVVILSPLVMSLSQVGRIWHFAKCLGRL